MGTILPMPHVLKPPVGVAAEVSLMLTPPTLTSPCPHLGKQASKSWQSPSTQTHPWQGQQTMASQKAPATSKHKSQSPDDKSLPLGPSLNFNTNVQDELDSTTTCDATVHPLPFRLSILHHKATTITSYPILTTTIASPTLLQSNAALSPERTAPHIVNLKHAQWHIPRSRPPDHTPPS